MIIPPIGAAGQLSLGGAGTAAPGATQAIGAVGAEQAAGAGEAASRPSGSFGSELTQAISSLEQTQQSAEQRLAGARDGEGHRSGERSGHGRGRPDGDGPRRAAED